MKIQELRRHVHAGLNKGEARNALARALFFNRLGEIRDRRWEHINLIGDYRRKAEGRRQKAEGRKYIFARCHRV